MSLAAFLPCAEFRRIIGGYTTSPGSLGTQKRLYLCRDNASFWRSNDPNVGLPVTAALYPQMIENKSLLTVSQLYALPGPAYNSSGEWRVNERARIFIESFLDGLTGAGVFGDLKLPDVPAPTRFFANESNMVAADRPDVPKPNLQNERERKRSGDSKPRGRI